MKKEQWNILGMVAVGALWLGLAVGAWFRPADTYSTAERRVLAQFPEISGEHISNGDFMSDFESYTTDQFPLRQPFRQLKAFVSYDLLGQRDNNGIYRLGSHIDKLEYPMDEASVDHALSVFQGIYDRYLGSCSVYAAVIPDKGYHLARQAGYPAMDYERLFQKVQNGMPYASYVNLEGLLTAEDYYYTDTHWRQERLLPVAQRLCDAMGAKAPTGLSAQKASVPFYGVYYGQAALPVPPDTLYTVQSDWLERCQVYNYETGKYESVYNAQKLAGNDPYETYLSGPVSLLRIENPQGQPGRTLIVFRDSFGSSLAPLLAMGYESVTLVDVRYINSAMLDRFIDFQEQDVLFIYSTLVLNNASQMR